MGTKDYSETTAVTKSLYKWRILNAKFTVAISHIIITHAHGCIKRVTEIDDVRGDTTKLCRFD